MLQIVIYKKLNFWEEYTPLHCTRRFVAERKKNMFRMREPTKMRRGESSEGPGSCLNCHLIQMGRFV